MDQGRRIKQKLLFRSVSGHRTIDQTGLAEVAHIHFREISERKSPCHCQIIGSCNGLLLISMNQDLYLYNLSTHRFNRTPLRLKYLTDSDYTVVGGLCVDSTTNDYMAVLAVSHESPCYHDFVTVGSFKNKSWTKISFPYDVRFLEQGTVLNNRLHWCVTDENEGSYFRRSSVGPSQHIVYFSPRRYALVKLPMPRPKDPKGDSLGSLGVLDGCLCVARRRDWFDSRCNVEVLIMKEYGVKESWSLLFKFRGVDFHRGFRVYFYTEKKDEVLMMVSISGEQKLVTYDIRRNRYTDTVRPIPLECFGSLPIVYEETLAEPPTYDTSSKKTRYE